MMKPGMYEYQIAAGMSNVYFDAGCERHAYAPIVGSGPNMLSFCIASHEPAASGLGRGGA